MQENSQRTYKYFNNRIHKIGAKLQKISLPGFQKIPIYDVFWFFINGLKKGSLNTRATSIAFNFLLALGPAFIFILALIPLIPVSNLKEMLFEVLFNVIPENSYIALEGLLNEIFSKHTGLSIFGLIIALFFAQKGIYGMMEAFNATSHAIETRPWYEQRLIAIGLVFIFFILTLLAGFLLFFSKIVLNKLIAIDIFQINLQYYLVLTGRWIIIVLAAFFTISFIYYLAPSRKTEWRFISAGSTLATLLTILASVGFSYFVNHFAQFNKFFGSIGALIAMMLWMNFNALTLLIGFELNASINHAHHEINKETLEN